MKKNIEDILVRGQDLSGKWKIKFLDAADTTVRIREMSKTFSWGAKELNYQVI